MNRRALIAPLMLGLTTASAVSSTELTGIITQVNGSVQLAGSGVSGTPLAKPWQVIRSGVKVHLPEAATAGIVCSNRRFVRLRGAASWSLTEAACATGKELTLGEYSLIAPQAGRFKVVAGLLTLEREIRAGDQDDPLAPQLLSPRNTVLRSPRPGVLWLSVQGAAEYRVEWRGRSVGYDTLWSATEVVCVTEQNGLNICSLAWPVDRLDLPPDQVFFLRIAARNRIADPWHWTEPVEVHTQKISAAEALESRLGALENLGFAGPALDVARANLLAQEGLYTDAAEIFRRSFATEPAQELGVTLGDVYLAMGLLQLAEPLYREAVTDGRPSVKAAAIFGLGRIAYARSQYQEAAMDFQQAQSLYAKQGLEEEGAAAHRAFERAVARSPH